MPKEKYSGKLLVEGKDDQHVFFAMCANHGIVESFDIIDCDGIENLKALIPVRLKQEVVKTLGIVVDADTNSNTIWDSLKSILHEFGYSLPANPVLGVIHIQPKLLIQRLGFGLCLIIHLQAC